MPAQRLEIERTRLHRLPDAPHAAALGTARVVNTDQTIRFGNVRCRGCADGEYGCRRKVEPLRSGRS